MKKLNKTAEDLKMEINNKEITKESTLQVGRHAGRNGVAGSHLGRSGGR